MAVFALTLLAAAAGAAIVFFRTSGTPSPVRKGSKKAPAGEQEPYLVTLASRIAALEVKVEDLPGLWSDERERMRRHADRAQQAERDAEKRAAKELEEDDELEGEEGGILPLFDGVGSPNGGMQPMPPGVAESPDDLKARAAQVLSVFGRR